MLFDTLFARENWRTKYQYKDEAPVETFDRVARALAEVEADYGATDDEIDQFHEDFFLTLVDAESVTDDVNPASEEDVVEVNGTLYRAKGLKATPGGRITSNAGTDFEETTLWNCFVASPVGGSEVSYDKQLPDGSTMEIDFSAEQTPDNLTNIMITLLETAETLKSEGGWGINMGFIRPRGELIEGVGIRHPGVVSYMDLWDQMSEVIVKGDSDGYEDTLTNHLEPETEDRIEKAMPRKGAMLAALPVWHPDVEEFVRAKEEQGRLTKFNISVLVDDAFMEAVQNDDTYDLHFDGKTYKRIKARELYELIMERTFTDNDPGLLFFDNLNRTNPILYLGPNAATNPCVTGDTCIATVKQGSVPIEDLVGMECEVYCVNPKTGEVTTKKASDFRKTGEDQDVAELHLEDGTSLRATPDHEFMLYEDGSFRELRHLEEGDQLSGHVTNEGVREGTKRVVTSVEPAGTADVYDCAVDAHHNYCVVTDKSLDSGVISHNCGEVGGSTFVDGHYKAEDYLEPYLPEGDEHYLGFTTVCLLGSINLTRFVREDRTFDWDRYKQTIRTFARMLEDVNDIDRAPLPMYEWAIEHIRQYGMGINGLGSTLMMLGLKYGTEEAVEFTEKVNQLKDDITLDVSAELARERGPFPMYSEEYLETPYFQDYCQADESTKDKVREHGVRNAKRLTNPPLGNSSVLCDNVSNGIEPIFSLEYERTVIADEWPEGLNKDNVDEHLEAQEIGDKTVWRGDYDGTTWYYEPHNRGICFVEPVRDYGYSWLLEHYPEAIDQDPDYITTTQELDVNDHVRMQAAVQRHVDQSVSKCLVEGQTVETTEGPMSIEGMLREIPDEEGFVEASDVSVYGPDGRPVDVTKAYYGGSKPAYLVEVEHTSDIRCSENHRFRTKSGEWKKASNLTPSDRLRKTSVQTGEQRIVQVQSVRSIGQREVYDIKVDSDDHAYLVNGLVSHNTVNVPEDYNFEDFKSLYMDAWEEDLVGITTYREGTREAVLETTDDGDEEQRTEDLLALYRERDLLNGDAEITDERVIVKDVDLPDEYANGPTQIVRRDGNKYYLHMSYLPGDNRFPVALWVHSNSLEDKEYVSLNRAVKEITRLLHEVGVDFDLVYEQQNKISDNPHHVRLGKMVSMALRHNVSMVEIVETLDGIEGDYVASTLSAVRKFIRNRIPDGTELNSKTCPSCESNSLIIEGGCDKCLQCGYGSCG